MLPSRVFLIANPTPCTLDSSDGLPCQKKEKSLSLTDPDSGSLVSCRATMSICSLLNSMSMTAVLRASLISCRLSEKPVCIVLTFHVPNFSAVDFSAGDFFFSFLFPFRFCLLLGALLTIRLSVFTLNPTHPVRLTNRGEATPYWLGFAQLKAGGSCLMRRDDLSHRRKQPLASSSTPIEQKTYNR